MGNKLSQQKRSSSRNQNRCNNRKPVSHLHGCATIAGSDYDIRDPRGKHGGQQNILDIIDGQIDVDETDANSYSSIDDTPFEEHTYMYMCHDNNTVYELCTQTSSAEFCPLECTNKSGSIINSIETVGTIKNNVSQGRGSCHDASGDQQDNAKCSNFLTHSCPIDLICEGGERPQEELSSSRDHKLQEYLYSLDEYKTIQIEEDDASLLAEKIKCFPEVQRLRICGIKQAASLPEDIVRLKALQALVFMQCTFLDSQEFTENETDLTEQYIIGTLPTPPPIITELTTLSELIMKDCQFEALPDNIGDLCQLEVLEISFNKYLDHLPSSIDRLVKLTQLRLCHCAFEVVPDVIGQLTSLQTIDLANNRLHSYPHVTLRLKQLTRLDLSNTPDGTYENMIEHIPVEIIDTFLKWLNIDYNTVMTPPAEVCRKGFTAIQTYLRNVRSGDGMHADSIIVVGEPKAGKSSVARSLVAKKSRLARKKSLNQALDQFSIIVDNQLLVNAVDFGSDDVTEEIISFLSSAEGIVLVVYDMSKDPRSEHEKSKGAGSLEDVQKWLRATLTRCSSARIIVVGTHSDSIEQQKRKSLEMIMKRHVMDVLKGVEADILKQKSSLEVRNGAIGLHRDVEKLNKRLEVVRKADVSVVTMSCFHDTDTGINRLISAICKRLRPSKPLRLSFWRIIRDIMSFKYEDGVDLLFLKWEQVESIYRRHVNGAVQLHEICDILRYLCNTSQIIWLEDHGNSSTMSRYIFHQPALIFKVCESIPGLDWKNTNSDRLELFSQHFSNKSRDGYLRECDLHFHWRKSLQFVCRQPSETLNVLVELMLHFHAIIEVAEEPCGRLFVNPRYFVEDHPAEQLALIERPFMPRINIKLKFIGSSAHRAHFAANLVAILAWAHSKNVLPVVWKRGVFFKVDGVYVLATEDRGVMDLIAGVESEKDDMWSVLIFIIQYLNHTVFAARSDTPHDVTVECPGCRCCGRHSPTAGCTERGRTTLGSLSRPLDQCTTVWQFCPDCKNDVPTCLINPCYTDNYTQENQEAVAKFFSNLRNTCKHSSESNFIPTHKDPEVKNCCLESSKRTVAAEEVPEYIAPKAAQPTDLVRQIRASRPLLIDALIIEDVRYIVDELYSKFLISQGQKELIEAGADSGNRPTAVRRLLDAIENRGHEAATVLISVLKSEKIDREDLVKLITSVQVPT